MQNNMRLTDNIFSYLSGCRDPNALAWPLVPCNGEESPAYNLDSLGEDRYRLTLAAPGYRPDDIEVRLDGGMLRVKGKTARNRMHGHRLHSGLSESLDYAFLTLEPLIITNVELSDGLLCIDLQGDWIDSNIVVMPDQASGYAANMAMAA